MAWMALFLLAASGWNREAPREFDWVEINHFYDSAGKMSYRQAIAWNWSPDYKRPLCEGWVLAEKWVVAKNSVIIHRADGEQIILRTKAVRITYTDKDPEREDKKLFEEKYRLGLTEK